MESAVLHNMVINIELEREKLEQQGLPRAEIRRKFDNDYRIFSRKSAFTCLCCQKPVTMNLTKTEGWSFYFRHVDGSECYYSENQKTYNKQVAKLEDKSKKSIGLTVFREILEGELKPFDVEIERGYLYKKKLSFIPDFIIRFPNTEERWAIDYFTAMNQGVVSGNYARHLSKRMETYKAEGFKPFSFVDHSWLSFLEITNKGTLLTAETYVTSKVHEDNLWDAFLKEHIHAELLDFFKRETGATSMEFNASNIAYVDVFNRLCTIFRFIPISLQDRNITFYKLSSSDVPLAKALTVNPDQSHFMLSSESEEDKRKDFLGELIKKESQYQLEQNRLKGKEESIRTREEERSQQKIPSAWAGEANPSRQGKWERELDDEELDRREQEIMREASLRPIELHPNQYNRHNQKYSLNNNYTFQQQRQKSNLINLKPEDDADNKKREKVEGILLSSIIKGESCINGKNSAWRIEVLKWIEENQSGGTLNVSLQKVINHMKKAGITFNQNDIHVKYPIKAFLQFYQKTIRTVLKKKIELVISD